jgi:hypothetical protein
VKTRIYKVVGLTPDDVRLVDASHPNAAIRHVAESIYSVSVASTKDVAALLGRGVKVEEAKHE